MPSGIFPNGNKGQFKKGHTLNTPNLINAKFVSLNEFKKIKTEVNQLIKYMGLKKYDALITVMNTRKELGIHEKNVI